MKLTDMVARNLGVWIGIAVLVFFVIAILYKFFNLG